MKIKILVITFIAVASSISSATEWTISGKDAEGKKSPVVTVVSNPKLMISTSTSQTALSIHFSDGKKKFGAGNISIKKGDITYVRPRLQLNVPLEKVNTVAKDKPLVVSEFSHKETQFQIKLVHSSKSKLPDIVVTKK